MKTENEVSFRHPIISVSSVLKLISYLLHFFPLLPLSKIMNLILDAVYNLRFRTEA